MTVSLHRTCLWTFVLILTVFTASTSVHAQTTEPLSFQPNWGQENAGVRYASTGAGYRLLLTERDATLVLQNRGDKAATVRMTLPGSMPASEVYGSNPVSSRSSYYQGNDPAKWITGVPGFGRVTLRNVYRGIDVVYYGNNEQFEYDFVVAPGTDPRKIQMAFEGATALQATPEGDLRLAVANGNVSIKRPIAYQQIQGSRRIVPAAYSIGANGRVRFELGAYDVRETLIIDPSILVVEYVDGGAGSTGTGRAIVANSSGVSFIAGYFNGNAFVKRFDPACAPGGSCSRWSTATLTGSGVGSDADEKAKDIALDAAGNVWIIGSTRSTNFPTTAGSLQANTDGTTSDAFIAKLAPSDLQLIYSTYFGGSSVDFGDSINVSNCNAVTCEINIAGTTGSDLGAALGVTFSDFPGTARGAGNNNGFVAKLIANSTRLTWGTGSLATYLGVIANRTSSTTDSGRRSLVVAGSGTDVIAAGAIPGPGANSTKTRAQVWRAGAATFQTSLHPVNDAANSFANAIAMDQSGDTHIAGETSSPSFPFNCIPATQFCQPVYNGTAGATSLDGFYAALNASGGIAYATYLGSTGIGGLDIEDMATGITVNASGAVLVAGKAGDQSFPHDGTPLAFAGTSNGFLAAFSASHTLLASSFVRPNTVTGSHQADAIGLYSNGDAILLGTSTAGSTLGPFVLTVGAPTIPSAGFSTFGIALNSIQPACPADPLALPPCYFSAQNPNLNPPPQIATVTVTVTAGLPLASAVALELLDSNNNAIDQVSNPTYVSTTAPLTISQDRVTWTFGILYRSVPPPGLATVRLRAVIDNQQCSPGDSRCFGAMTLVGLPAITGVILAPSFVPQGTMPTFVSPGKVIGGNTTSGKAVLNTGALTPVTVFVSSNNVAAVPAPSALVNGSAATPESVSQAFTIATIPVTTVTPVTIGASLTGGAGTATGMGTLNVLPNVKFPASASGLVLSPTSAASGATIVATATLDQIVPNSPLYPDPGVTFKLVKVVNGVETVVGTGVILKGQSSGTVSFTAESVSQTTVFSLRAKIDASAETNLSSSVTVPLTVSAVGLSLSAFTVQPGAVSSGGSVAISATLNGPATSIMTIPVTLPWGLPVSIVINSGSTSGQLTISAPVVIQTTTHTLSATLGSAAPKTATLVVTPVVPTATVIPFKKFAVDVATGLKWGDDRDTFRIKGEFSLGNASNGINPVTERVALRVGPYSVTIPAGSFKLSGDRDGDGDIDHHGCHVARRYRFKGTINGVVLDVRIRHFGNNEYDLRVHGRKADLTGIVKGQPVTVDFAIGDDNGQATDRTPKTRIRSLDDVKVSVDLSKKGDRDAFDVDADFVFDDDHNINPTTQPVTLAVGGYSITVPAGSFRVSLDSDKSDKKEYRSVRVFTFNGTINGDSLEIRIRDLGRHEWDLKAHGKRLDLSDIVKGQPVTVSLTIGSVNAEGDDSDPRVK